MQIHDSSRSNSKRRSISQPNNSLSLSIGEDNQDELERRASGVNYETIRRRLSVYNQESQGNSPTVTGHFGDFDIKNHFETCLKLFAENKINQKNAWCLKIIDFMSSTINKHKDPLQIGSTSLDVSARIYSVRVDDIHADGLKLAGSILKQAETVENNEDIDESVIEDGDSKKKKIRKKRFKASVLKDPQSLYGKLQKLDSRLFHSNVDPDLGPVANLCTFKMLKDNSESKFMLLCDQKAWPSDVNTDDSVTNWKKVSFTTLPLVSSERICPVFKDFIIDEIDETEGANFATDFNEVANEDTLAYNNFSIPVLDKSVTDEQFDDNYENGYIKCVDPIGDDLFMATIMNNTLARAPSTTVSVENCQRFRNIEYVWAGPSHWKLKCITPSKSHFTGQTDKKNTVRHIKKNANTKVEYDLLNYPPLVLNKKVKQKRACASEEKLLLPSSIKMSDFATKTMQLMSKPGTYLVAKETVENEEDVEEMNENYNYDNLNDSQYCPNANSEEVADDMEVFAYDGDNLIQQPEMVPKSTLTYAMQAKQIDMKKLKSIMWDSICCYEKNGKEKACFSNIYKSLTIKLTKNMKKELTAPLAFVALLHLSNEHNLELHGQADLRDFKILHA